MNSVSNMGQVPIAHIPEDSFNHASLRDAPPEIKEHIASSVPDSQADGRAQVRDLARLARVNKEFNALLAPRLDALHLKQLRERIYGLYPNRLEPARFLQEFNAIVDEAGTLQFLERKGEAIIALVNDAIFAAPGEQMPGVYDRLTAATEGLLAAHKGKALSGLAADIFLLKEDEISSRFDSIKAAAEGLPDRLKAKVLAGLAENLDQLPKHLMADRKKILEDAADTLPDKQKDKVRARLAESTRLTG